jgi:hypothetical protein
LGFAGSSCGGKRETLFVYHDLRCDAPSPGGSVSCHDVGDGRSYVECATDSDCPARAKFCRTLGLFKGGDYSCNAMVQICREVDRNDCVP